MPCYAGLDLGTSGTRLCVIDQHKSILAEARIDHREPGNKQSTQQWWHAIQSVFKQLPTAVAGDICALAVDGTSGTLVLINKHTGEALSAPLYYDDHDAGFTQEGIDLASCSDTFVRALRLLKQYRESGKSREKENTDDIMIVSQADYIQAKLRGCAPVSDYNNCFKLGYDKPGQCWSHWMQAAGVSAANLPEVRPPGSVAGTIKATVAIENGLDPALQLVTGTTDSVAAVMATGIRQLGSAVTSLGSTLVLKILSDRPVTSQKYGVYSQPYFDQWLVGGASNCGARILSHFFSYQQIMALSEQVAVELPTGLHYYPLLLPGERFPKNDPCKQPQLEPRPESDVVFFQALLESLSQVEKQGYECLQRLTGMTVDRIVTVGGGSQNAAWQKLREKNLKATIQTVMHSEAAYGSALLALRGMRQKAIV